MFFPLPITLAAVSPAPTRSVTIHPAGSVVVARAGSDAVLIWDATILVADLREKKIPADEALHAIESSAAILMAEKAATLGDAKTVTIRVVYPRKPEFNPQYNADVLTSVERLLDLKASRDAILKEGKEWPAELSSGKVSSAIAITITGKLPPG